uniref:LETM1 domain-containing protein n=1 Tax=Rhabditophanes sp. KR3021 TaxID=114890 RepID=A0AC35TSI7_9BILA
MAMSLSCRQMTPEKPKEKIGLMKKYENYLEANHPKTYALHRQIIDGCKWCISDLKCYWHIRKGLKSDHLKIETMTKEQLEVYLQHFPAISSKVKYGDFVKLPINFAQINSTNVIVPELEALDAAHMYHLLRFHQVSPFNGLTKLRARSLALSTLDNKLRESPELITEMKEIEVITQLQIRKINFNEDENEETLRNRLVQWIEVSDKFRGKDSLHLHAAVVAQSS